VSCSLCGGASSVCPECQPWPSVGEDDDGNELLKEEPMTLYKCNQAGCEQPGLYRYTWPGRDEAHVCELHVARLREIAAAMGLSLQVISVLEFEERGHEDKFALLLGEEVQPGAAEVFVLYRHPEGRAAVGRCITTEPLSKSFLADAAEQALLQAMRALKS
jgi:hypothetical protein